MRSVCFRLHKKFFFLTLLLVAGSLFAQEMGQNQNPEGTPVVVRHEVFSYEAERLIRRLPDGTHHLVISGPMDTYMLGNLRDAMLSKPGVLFSLDLSAVSALFDLDKETLNNCRNLVSLVIPDGLVRIRWQCFLGCDNLTAINATDGNDVFSSSKGILYDKAGSEVVVCPCGWNGAVEIPLAVSSVRSGAFSNCPKVTGFVLETRTEEFERDGKTELRVIENDTFSTSDGILYTKDKKRLVQFPSGKSGRVTIPDTVETIGKESFAYGARVTAVELPASVRTIEKMAFGYCSALETVSIPASVTSIGKQAFVWCTALGSVTIPSSVTYLGSRSFFKSSVSTVTFEDATNWTFGKKILVDLTNPTENAEKFRHPGKYWFLDLYKVPK